MRVQDIKAATQEQMLQNLLDTLQSLRAGHFTARMTEGFPGLFGEIARVLNSHLESLGQFAREHHRLMEEVGVTGRLGGQMDVPGLGGEWQHMLDDVNRLGGNVTNQFRDGANVVRDLLNGQRAARMTAQSVQGEFASFRIDLNRLADEFAARREATPVAPV
ncbi:MAG: hypothetical protein QM770_00165 [Tepidisphaeraceae bacterium]